MSEVVKPFAIKVTVEASTGGVADNLLEFTEYATDPIEYVFKQQGIYDAVVASLNGDNEAGTGGVQRDMGNMFLDAYDPSAPDGGTADFVEAIKGRGKGLGRVKKQD